MRNRAREGERERGREREREKETEKDLARERERKHIDRRNLEEIYIYILFSMVIVHNIQPIHTCLYKKLHK